MIPVVVYYFSKVKRTTNLLILKVKKVGGGKKKLSFNAFRRPQRALLEIWESHQQGIPKAYLEILVPYRNS